jgi:hypothetical protein
MPTAEGLGLRNVDGVDGGLANVRLCSGAFAAISIQSTFDWGGALLLLPPLPAIEFH